MTITLTGINGAAARIPPGPPKAARGELREKIAARPKAEAVLQEASAQVARVRQVMAEARCAHDDAQRAAVDSEERAREWAAAGAPEAEAPSDLTLLAAQRSAAAAVTRAKGARLALPGLLADEDYARNLLGNHDLEIRGAAALVVLDEVVAPLYARALEARAAYLEGVRVCEALLELTSHRWGSAHPFHGFSSGHERCDAMLRELAIPDAASDPAVRELVDRLASFARQLCADAEAAWTE
jgi:hypothetical protein